MREVREQGTLLRLPVLTPWLNTTVNPWIPVPIPATWEHGGTQHAATRACPKGQKATGDWSIAVSTACCLRGPFGQHHSHDAVPRHEACAAERPALVASFPQSGPCDRRMGTDSRGCQKQTGIRRRSIPASVSLHLRRGTLPYPSSLLLTILIPRFCRAHTPSHPLLA